MQSSSTLNSEDSRFSPTGATSAKPKGSCSNIRTNKSKDTFLSRLTQQFLKVARPHKEIEWQIKRNKLNRIIYEQSDKFLTCPYKLELDGGLGASNPKLTLYVHPYGCEDDCNISITLEVGIEISARPKKAQRLDSRAEVEVRVRVEDRERNVTFGNRVVRESVRLNYFFIKGFLSHQELKQSHSEHVVINISANLISVV